VGFSKSAEIFDYGKMLARRGTLLQQQQHSLRINIRIWQSFCIGEGSISKQSEDVNSAFHPVEFASLRNLNLNFIYELAYELAPATRFSFLAR
jgi:hypothetical protein